MDYLGAVASCIAVVSLVLQSTKVLYEATSSIKNGSDSIDKLLKGTQNLQQLLEIIAKIAEHAERTKNVADGRLLEQLTPVVKKCADDLAEVPPMLERLQNDTGDSRWKKVKKHARVYLDTKGVADIWNVVNHSVQLLGARLSCAAV